MRNFTCPACEKPTIAPARKWASSSLNPVHCSECGAQVYASSRQSSLWRILESFLVTLVVIRALIGFSWWLVVIAVLIVVAMEALRLFLVPLVRLRREGDGVA